MNVDMPFDALCAYEYPGAEPEDFDAFWQASLDEAAQHPLDLRIEPVSTEFPVLSVWDVTFNGFGGHPIKAWLKRPAAASGDLPLVVEYVGYGSGRGDVLDNTFWALAGFAHLVMDVRGQGANGMPGETPDPVGSRPAFPGSMTRGILDPHDYYYRRVYIDAARAVDAARGLPGVDPARVAVAGGSQGGAQALAAAGLCRELAGVVAFVPFLSAFERALEITDVHPYAEISRYLRVRRGDVAQVHRTLAYVDTVHHARRATAPALYSTALADSTCPPSTVFGSFRAYGGEKRIEVWPYNGHEGGGYDDLRLAARFLAPLLRGEPVDAGGSAEVVLRREPLEAAD